MIAGFGDKTTRDIYDGIESKDARKLSPILWSVICRKLDMIQSAQEIRDLMAPPGNRLEPLKGKLKEFHSIRVNNQYRIIFHWSEGAAYEVKVTDYH